MGTHFQSTSSQLQHTAISLDNVRGARPQRPPRCCFGFETHHHICRGRGKGKKSGIAAFDLTTALTKKEANMMRKKEPMIQYHLARMPFRDGKSSPEWAAAEGLREDIEGIKLKARKRWDEMNGL